MFLLGLYLSAELLNVSLPSSIAEEIENDPQLEKLASLVAKEYLREQRTGRRHHARFLSFMSKFANRGQRRPVISDTCLTQPTAT
jgi:hypothetical protein